jgi:hypothetical protein
LEFNHHASVLPAPHHALKFEHQEAARMTIRPDVSVGSKTVVTPLKWDVCITPESRHRSAAAAMTDPDPNPFSDCDVIVCYGGDSSIVELRKLVEEVECFQCRSDFSRSTSSFNSSTLRCKSSSEVERGGAGQIPHSQSQAKRLPVGL